VATINSGNSTTLYSTTQTTTSVTPSPTLPQGQVNDTNFTTLYSNTTAATTGGAASGNLLVTGNLRVLGTSDLEGAVTIGNSYVLPTSDGTVNQVVVTDGNGNLTFQNVTSLSSYAIQADTATGGANLTLVGSSATDSVKFAGGTNITVSRTDASTITISTNADDIPSGTARGQVLYWDGSAWTANSNISASAAANRLIATYENSTAGVNTALFLRKDFGATAYTINDGVGLSFQLDSNSQVTNQIATIAASWDTSVPEISLNTNINNNIAGPFLTTATFTTALATMYGDLVVQGGDITTTQTTANIYNTGSTTVNVGNGATTEVNLGNVSSGRVQVKSPSFETLGSASIATNLTVDSGTLFVNAATNSIGVNTITPSYSLDVQGSGNVSSNFTVDSGTLFVNAATNSVGINTVTPSYSLEVQGSGFVSSNFTVHGSTTLGNDYIVDTTSVVGQFDVTNNSVSNLRVDKNSGFTGLNTTTPAAQLDVNGNAIVGSDLAVNGGDITTTSTTGNLFNTNATTVNIGNAATTEVNLGNASTGRVHVLSPSFEADGNATITLDLAVNGGDITTTATTAQLFNTNATTVNIGDAATTEVNLGNTGSGRVQIKSPTIVGANTTQTVFNTVATTVNAFGASTATAIGSTASGTTTIGFNATVNGDLAVNGGDITTTQTTGNLFNATATTVNIGDGATSQVNIGNHPSGTVNIKSQSLLQNDLGGASTTFNLFNTITTDLNIGGAATTVDIGANSGTMTIGNPTVVGTQTTQAVFNTVATTVNAFGASTATAIGSTVSGTTTIGYDLVVNNSINADFISVDNRATLDSSTLTTTSTATVSLTTTTRNAMTGLINIIQGANVHCLNYTVLRVDATTAMLTTYAEMYNTSSLATFTADVSAGSLRLRVTPTSATSTVFSVVRTSLT
jgi:hypothetical protein